MGLGQYRSDVTSRPLGDPYLHPPAFAVREVVARCLAEDLTPLGDLSASLIDPTASIDAQVVARAEGRLAGTAAFTEAFAQLDPSVTVTWRVPEGAVVGAKDVLADVSGPTSSVLTGERTALNLLGHLSGVATLAARFQAAVDDAGGTARIWDTRKTLPGLRSLEKAAVRAGGCANHRGNLSELVMLKDNHLGDIGITEGVRRAKERWPARTVQVECERIQQVDEAVRAGADALLLDNMTPDQVRECVALVAELAPGDRRPLVEASGGMALDTVGAYGATGVDFISVGAITNSAPVLDVGLDLA
jgi:nicotinate-nucleotide pyrophosphorylase (carboxylating)